MQGLVGGEAAEVAQTRSGEDLEPPGRSLALTDGSLLMLSI